MLVSALLVPWLVPSNALRVFVSALLVLGSAMPVLVSVSWAVEATQIGQKKMFSVSHASILCNSDGKQKQLSART